MEIVEFNGWKNCVRLANREVEVIATTDVGPRVIRFGFQGERNLFAEIPDELGGQGERTWKIRGGHRLWLAPEDRRRTYEPDNSPVKAEAMGSGVRIVQKPGKITGVEKCMEMSLAPRRNQVRLKHILTNRSSVTVRLAPWALTVMAPDGMAIIPLPPKISHKRRLTHNQEWSIWGYTDFADGRWTFGSRYIFFRHDRSRGPGKMGIAHHEGWVAYWLTGFLFVKRFGWIEGAVYPDGGVNFETFANEDFLELESLGPLVDLDQGASVQHEEVWELFRNVPPIRSESDIAKNILPLVAER
ncbi:MAG: hypothetical protein ACUVWX_10145 [Kiritimatiellia bacterium]